MAAPDDLHSEQTSDTDPNDRVHHHARLDERGDVPPGTIVTLCGLRLRGKRPEAAELPCCPMCAAEMGSLGRRCS